MLLTQGKNLKTGDSFGWFFPTKVDKIQQHLPKSLTQLLLLLNTFIKKNKKSEKKLGSWKRIYMMSISIYLF